MLKTNKKIVLIQLWIGKIPDYFWYHYETTKNLPIDFLFVTNQNIQLDSNNYKVLKISEEQIKQLIHQKIGKFFDVIVYRNISQLKPSLGDLFSEYITNYDYFGYYDIDTLFGDVHNYLNPYLDSFEVISFATEVFHNRTSGVLTILKNTENNRVLYKNRIEVLIEKFVNYDIHSFDEHEFNELLLNNLKVKLLYDVCNISKENGKLNYDAEWSGGIVKVNGVKKMIHHFYDKENTGFDKVGNLILTYFKKMLRDDFYWVSYLTENIENNVTGLVESLKKYSNRKCIFYTINFESNLKYKLNEQFIFRKLDIPLGDIGPKGIDVSVISSKPIILKDSVNFIKDTKFIYIDSDVYLTNVADNLSNFFHKLENFPLMNSYFFDKLLTKDQYPNQEWVSTLDILSETANIPIKIFPRRKSNVILYDKNSEWFFDEQMDIYHKYKKCNSGIFKFYDEDSANILLSKYNFTECLPVVDMEESTNIDFEKIKNYTNNLTPISNLVKLPRNENELYFFSNLKDSTHFLKIENDYGKSVLECSDILMDYKNKLFRFKKNSFLSDKKFPNKVDFIVSFGSNIILSLLGHQIFNYWFFFVSNVDLPNEILDITILDSDTKKIIYKNIYKNVS